MRKDASNIPSELQPRLAAAIAAIDAVNLYPNTEARAAALDEIGAHTITRLEEAGSEVALQRAKKEWRSNR